MLNLKSDERGLLGIRLLIVVAVVLVGWALYNGYLHYSGPRVKIPKVSIK